MLFDNRKAALFLSLIFAASCGGGAYAWLGRKEKAIRDKSSKVKVWVAKKFLRAGETIDPRELEEKLIPPAYLQPTAFENISDLSDDTGHPLFASSVGFLKGEQITRARVIERSARWDMAWAIEPGHLGLTLSLDAESAGGGHLKPGDWVAVLAVIDPQPGIAEARSNVIESRVQVSAVNGRLLGMTEGAEQKSGARNLSNDPFLVTLSVTSRQANRIFLARSRGRIALALRSAVDDETLASAAVRISDLRISSEAP